MRPILPLLLIGLFCTQPAASRDPGDWEDDGFTVQYSHPGPALPRIGDSLAPTPHLGTPDYLPAAHAYIVTEATSEEVPTGLVWASRFVNGFMVSGGIFFLSLIVRQALGI